MNPPSLASGHHSRGDMTHVADTAASDSASDGASTPRVRSPGKLRRSLSSPADHLHRHALPRSSTIPLRLQYGDIHGGDDPLASQRLRTAAEEYDAQPAERTLSLGSKLQGSILEGLPAPSYDMVPFNLEQIKGFRDAMSFLDRDNDGRVDRTELSYLMRFLGHPVSLDAVDALLQAMSHGANGDVGFREFLTTTGASITHKGAQEELQAAFQLFDTDGRGYLTPASLMAAMEAMGDSLTEAEAAEMIAEADPECDGRLRFDAFHRYLQGPLPHRFWNVPKPKW
eukprot:jgi/Mesvir1/16328/Mv09818-RA.1